MQYEAGMFHRAKRRPLLLNAFSIETLTFPPLSSCPSPFCYRYTLSANVMSLHNKGSHPQFALAPLTRNGLKNMCISAHMSHSAELLEWEETGPGAESDTSGKPAAIW
jgi:hypothetical protein